MRIAVVGAGAIGSYYGARLAQAGHEVHFLLRSDYEHVLVNGLVVKSVHGDFGLPKVHAHQSSHSIGSADLVIVAWKATSNHLYEEVITPLVGKNTQILTLQNGLGNVEALSALFGSDRVLGGLCFVCINRVSPGVIDHSASGLIRLARADGPVDDYLESLVAELKKANVPCEAVDCLEAALWLKLVWNFPFNGLAIAEGGVDTQILLGELNLESKVRALMLEVISVAAALGHRIDKSVVDQQIEITRPMGAYRPSSMIDFVDGRPVEVDAIWRKPLAVAQHLGLDVPEMEELCGRVVDKVDLRVGL